MRIIWHSLGSLVFVASCASTMDASRNAPASRAMTESGRSASATQASPVTESASSCAPNSGLAVQVLGSGGPRPDDGRASSGYLVWVDGKAEVLIDAGGGTFSNYGASGASLNDLELIALSHFHTDHSAEVPALLKGTFFGERRSNTLLISGPNAGGDFPGVDEVLEAWFGSRGVYRYLSWLMRPGDGAVDLEAIAVDPGAATTSVMERGAVTVEAMGVPHGPVPTLAYRVRHGDTVVVFGGDNNGDAPEFVDFARGASILVMHHAVPEDADDVAAKLHALPSEIGRIAGEAGAETLVLSHHMQRSLERLEQARGLIAERYSGRIVIAQDMACITLDDGS